MKLHEIRPLNEGINDKNIFKAILLAGGPGSGKGFIVKQIIGKQGPVSGLGAVVLNSDVFFEKALLKTKLPLNIDPKDVLTFAKQMEQRDIAKKIAKSRLNNILNGMLPLVLDGTGRDRKKILDQAEALRNIGYDVGMIFVNTSLEVAIARNEKRARKVPPKLVTQAWNNVQKSLGTFQAAFNPNFFIIDNSKNLTPGETKKLGNELFKVGKKFFNSPLKNPIGVGTVAAMKDMGAKVLSDINVGNVVEL